MNPHRQAVKCYLHINNKWNSHPWPTPRSNWHCSACSEGWLFTYCQRDINDKLQCQIDWLHTLITSTNDNLSIDTAASIHKHRCPIYQNTPHIWYVHTGKVVFVTKPKKQGIFFDHYSAHRHSYLFTAFQYTIACTWLTLSYDIFSLHSGLVHALFSGTCRVSLLWRCSKNIDISDIT